MMTSEHLVRALLTVLAVLEDAVKLGMTPEVALSALENVSYDLGQMTTDERRDFFEVLQRVAASVDPVQHEWILDVPSKLNIDL